MIDKDLALKMYTQMVFVRRLNGRCVELKREGKIPGPVHQTDGQEAIGVGFCAALQPEDWISTYYRGMTEWLARGMDPTAMVAELLARKGGICRGKGGEMALADPSVGIMCASGIVGGNIPVGTGLGFAARNRRDGRVVVVFFGDGAVNTGAFHEALNMGAAFRLPVVYVCVNNRYAISTYIGDVVANLELSDRARGYGMPGAVVENANDVLEVYDAAMEAVSRARSGGGPTFLEARTFRIGGHSSTNPETYTMNEAEMERWQKERDPILLFRKRIVDDRLALLDELEEIDDREADLADDAVDKALRQPEPDLAEAISGLWF